MWRTRVGYAGGTKQAPTYHSLGDHTECFQADFDPTLVRYDDLLQLFWTSHDPTRPAWKTQYASLILANDEAQLEAAQASAKRFSAAMGRQVETRIELLGTFWLAEDYHQKYYLRNDRLLMPQFRAMYPEDAEFVNSTAAARVNGYLRGSTDCSRLDREVSEFGLSEEGAGRLKTACQRR